MKTTASFLHSMAFATVLLVFTPLSHASQFLVLNTAAYHFENSNERRSLTPGIGWEYSPSSKTGFHIGTLADSFGYQATYAGINWATRTFDWKLTKIRLILGATLLNKQFHKDSDPETKLLPLPAMEIALTKKTVLNISGSPQIDYAGQKNNAVIFFQVKWNTQ